MQKYGTFIFIPTFAITLVLVFSLSIFLILKLYVFQRSVKNRGNSFKQATLTTVYISFIFMVCYILRHLFPIVATQPCLSCEKKAIVAAYMTAIIYLNSALNPIVYITRGNMLREETMTMLISIRKDVRKIKVSSFIEELSKTDRHVNKVEVNGRETQQGRRLRKITPFLINDKSLKTDCLSASDGWYFVILIKKNRTIFIKLLIWNYYKSHVGTSMHCTLCLPYKLHA